MRPRDVDKIIGVELLSVYESAVIPLPVARKLMQPYATSRGDRRKSGAAVRYDAENKSRGDLVERWLNNLLCLDCNSI